MILKRMFGRGQREPTLRHLNLEGEGLEHEADHEGVRVWRTEEGDAIGVYCFNVPPDLPRGQSNENEFLDAYSAGAHSQGASVVELEICDVGGYQALRSIVKVPQQPIGLTYVGAFTLPVRDHSFVVKIQCEERGMTGVREAVLMDSAVREGRVQVAADGTIEGEWNPDDVCHDGRFPDHALTRTRRWLPRIRRALSVDKSLTSVPKFEWPG
jgi:hypothetical protein